MTDWSTFVRKHVLVTGAASGLGRALAERFVDAGASVSALDIDRAGLDRLTGDIEARMPDSTEPDGPVLLPVVCDLRDPVSMQRAIDEVRAEIGEVDILINNAGVVAGKPFTEQSDEDLVRTFEVNTFAPVRMTRLVLPAMIARDQGHVVTIASAGGLIATPRLSTYAASKFAAVGFDEALRLELREAGSSVCTTVVCPYFIDTGMFEGVRSRFPLLPVLTTERVADRVVAAIRRRRRRLLLPWLVYLLYPLRLLPVSVFDRLVRWLGVTSAMRGFRGRDGNG